MNKCLLPAILILLPYTAFAQVCSNDDSAALCETKAAVSRVLSYPSYSVSDEKVLNRAGDMAAVAVIRSISMEDLNSPEKVRQILLILNLAFGAPQLIATATDRRPTAAMLLLDHLSKTKYDRENTNEIQNTLNEVQHNSSTRHPLEFGTLEGAPPLDVEHTQWVGSVLRWAYDVKPGMTREALLRVYTVEGGLSNRMQRTYVLKGCPYVKVDVEFAPVGNPQDYSTESPDDKILKISKPYLEYSITD